MHAEADQHIAQGQALEDAGDYAGAEAQFRAAVAAAPNYPRAHLNLSNALVDQQRLVDAEAPLREAVRLDTRYVGAWFNLGRVLAGLARWGEAREALEQALALQPDLADAHVLVAMTHEGEGDLERACESLRQALALRPDLAGAWNNLGFLLLQRSLQPEGEAALRRAVALDPGIAIARGLLAVLDVGRGRLEAASEGFEQALKLQPRDLNVWGTYLFSLNLRHDVDAQAVAQRHFQFGDLMTEVLPPRPRAAIAAGRRPLRVGYVSSDFKTHPVAWFVEPVLRHHDPREIVSYCYSGGEVDRSTATVRAAAREWRVISGMSDEDVLRLVDRDRIDILVDLSGHTTGHRLGVFARRAAPVQATWLGYLNTTGLRTMDYRITDGFTDPPGQTEVLNAEKLARMPHSQWVYVPHTPQARTNERPRGAREPLVFGSFNQVPKISNACLDLWADVMRRVPGSQLRVHGVRDPIAGEYLVERLEQRGVARERVTIAGRLAIPKYMEAIAEVDLALDSFPYNGGTTTLDTYWMGVPLVALCGERAISRASYSIASSAGFGELITRSPQEYIERNVELARDAAARVALRRELRPRLEASPLMDAKRFTRDLEALFRGMVQETAQASARA